MFFSKGNRKNKIHYNSVLYTARWSVMRRCQQVECVRHFARNIFFFYRQIRFEKKNTCDKPK